MPRRSTTTNLVTYLDYVTKRLDDKEPVDVLYLDFAKAFDKVPHKRLIQKIKCYKFSEKLVNWIEAWLTNRKQRVIVNGVASDWRDVISSVVQGSVLGPILFIIFINDIDLCLSHFEAFVSKFADDTKIAKVVTDGNSAMEMQAIIQNLEKWCTDWGMEFNISKCTIMHFGHNNPKFEYTMNGQKLSSSSEQRDLGVIVSETSSPSKQCASAAKKANQMLGRINKSFSCFTKDIMKLIYKVFVRPHLEYAVAAWSPWLRKDIDALEAIQRRATRRISDIRGSYDERLKALKITTLEKRRIRGDAIEIFKCLHGVWSINSESLFTLRDPEGPRTRQQQSFMPLTIPRARLDIRKYFFSVRAANIWNDLPSSIRESNSVNIFKNAYDNYTDVD